MRPDLKFGAPFSFSGPFGNRNMDATNVRLPSPAHEDDVDALNDQHETDSRDNEHDMIFKFDEDDAEPQTAKDNGVPRVDGQQVMDTRGKPIKLHPIAKNFEFRSKPKVATLKKARDIPRLAADVPPVLGPDGKPIKTYEITKDFTYRSEPEVATLDKVVNIPVFGADIQPVLYTHGRLIPTYPMARNFTYRTKPKVSVPEEARNISTGCDSPDSGYDSKPDSPTENSPVLKISNPSEDIETPVPEAADVPTVENNNVGVQIRDFATESPISLQQLDVPAVVDQSSLQYKLKYGPPILLPTHVPAQYTPSFVVSARSEPCLATNTPLDPSPTSTSPPEPALTEIASSSLLTHSKAVLPGAWIDDDGEVDDSLLADAIEDNTETDYDFGSMLYLAAMSTIGVMAMLS